MREHFTLILFSKTLIFSKIYEIYEQACGIYSKADVFTVPTPYIRKIVRTLHLLMNEDSKYDIFSIMPRRVYGLKRRGLGRVEGLVGEVEIMQAGLARTSKHPTSMHNC